MKVSLSSLTNFYFKINLNKYLRKYLTELCIRVKQTRSIQPKIHEILSRRKYSRMTASCRLENNTVKTHTTFLSKNFYKIFIFCTVTLFVYIELCIRNPCQVKHYL